MLIFPAIDLYQGQAVRLFKGDYAQKTVYSDRPVKVAQAFAKAGAECIHIVDLEGAASGQTPNADTILDIKRTTGLFCEVGGGIRSIEVIEKYLSAGIDRVILGTAAIKDPDLLKKAIDTYGDKIAVGVDIKDGYVAIKGWTEKSRIDAFEMFDRCCSLGVKTIICTDISLDGAMRGANRELYRQLSSKFSVDIVASGGVSSMTDVTELAHLGLYGAIIGKAYYEGALDLAQAIKEAK